MLGLCFIGLMAASSFDPAIDQAREPPGGWSVGAGLERHHDTLGAWLELRSPRMLDDHLAIAVGGGVGWFPNVLPETEREVSVGPWSPFAHVRVRAEVAARMAESPHRLFLALGPSLIVPQSELSTSEAGFGGLASLGAELFLGDRYRTAPVAVVFELGAVAHLARADARVGEAEAAAPLATGFFLSVGLRLYPE